MNQDGMEDYSQDENVLAKFGRNINDDVRAGKIDPVIGRDDEIRKVITICGPFLIVETSGLLFVF